MANGLSIVGRKENIDFDFYETPKWATEKAIEAMLIDGIINKYDNIYEPCCGAGAITDVLEIYGFENIKKSDIQTNEEIKLDTLVSYYDFDAICFIVIKSREAYDWLYESMYNYYGLLTPEYDDVKKENFNCAFYYDFEYDKWVSCRKKIRECEKEIEKLSKYVDKM